MTSTNTTPTTFAPFDRPTPYTPEATAFGRGIHEAHGMAWGTKQWSPRTNVSLVASLLQDYVHLSNNLRWLDSTLATATAQAATTREKIALLQGRITGLIHELTERGVMVDGHLPDIFLATA